MEEIEIPIVKSSASVLIGLWSCITHSEEHLWKLVLRNYILIIILFFASLMYADIVSACKLPTATGSTFSRDEHEKGIILMRTVITSNWLQFLQSVAFVSIPALLHA